MQAVGGSRALPPGQHRVEGFPRFGTHLHHPPPVVPDDPVLEVRGDVVEPVTLRLADLEALGRTEATADFHCVAGWSATDLRWGGFPFAAFYGAFVAPAVAAGEEVTHLVLRGLDGYAIVVAIEDALGADVLLADRLDGLPLDGDHGAPLRLVSPSQYGYVSAKHLCRIDVRCSEPDLGFGAADRLVRLVMRPPLFDRHPRSRVWHEERNGSVPSWLIRPVYRLLTPPILFLCGRGRGAVPGPGRPRGRRGARSRR